MSTGADHHRIPDDRANRHPSSPTNPTDFLVECGLRGDTATLRAHLTHDDPSLRSLAVAGLSRLDALDADDLRRALTDPDPAVRRRSAQAAARRPDPVRESLRAALGDEPTVAEIAAFALGELAESDDETVRALEHTALEHPDALCRESAVAALGSLGAGRATILAALGDKPAVRRRAVIALSPFDGPDVEAALRRALDDRDWQVRQAAEDLLDPPD